MQDMTTVTDYHLGCRLPPATWAHLNREQAFRDAAAASEVAPFPPPELMQNVSGLTNEHDFASHGADFWLALSSASPKPLTEYRSVLDFGCGCGRLARMFKGHPGTLHGCDIDARHVAWIAAHLPYVTAIRTEPDQPLPYANSQFDLIVSISVFTHLDEPSQDLLLAELARIARPDGNLMLTIHGERAIQRALNEKMIWDMISVDRALFAEARDKFVHGRHAFILQQGHLTQCGFRYGITFLPRDYIGTHWGKWFKVRDHVSGALHDFQDVVVLSPR